MIWLISLLLACCSSQALTAKTSNIIHGNAPYLTFDGGLTSETSSEGFLWITLSDGTKFTPSMNDSSSSPIELPNSGESFADIGMLVPTDSNSIALNSLISAPNHYWGDDDGDGQGSDGIIVTGNLNLTITDKYNQPVSRTAVLDICKAPYKITLTSSDGTLTTGYGVPKSSYFNASNVTYHVNPKLIPKVCFAKPSIEHSSNDETIIVAGNYVTPDFRGPSTIWADKKGFITQSTNLSSYGLNFPTTGANNLYFDLIIVGSGPLNWAPVTRSGITATMMPDSTGTKVKVTLTGPFAEPRQWYSNNPSNIKTISRPILPQTFELVGRDNSGKDIVKYGFKLKQWFVSRGNGVATPGDHELWCENIGYRMPGVKDLTNAKRDEIAGATPWSTGINYQRQIGAGLFTEWGSMSNYNDAEFKYVYYYWVKEVHPDNDSYQFDVDQKSGFIGWYPKSTTRTSAVCVTP
ncbi:hypothetical protein DKK70_12065 [Gilliamella apicola]|uniref:Uncharacterized protein n=1 Tax=Gilliamella apicola TaxID=1196095 RepID=A0A2V4E3B5_9GAMM|nr:hypothetical protein [Gilliamella apicola]PXZ05316.1 hypothetical protein DKK70_12065 [Gilliamella apicola]